MYEQIPKKICLYTERTILLAKLFSLCKAIYYYPALHQSSAELVLCVLLTHTHKHSDIYFFLTFHQLGSFGRKVSKGIRPTLCLV